MSLLPLAMRKEVLLPLAMRKEVLLPYIYTSISLSLDYRMV